MSYDLNPRLVRGLDYYRRTASRWWARVSVPRTPLVEEGGTTDCRGPRRTGGAGRRLRARSRATRDGGAGTRGCRRAPWAAVILPLEQRAVGPALTIARGLRDEGVAVDVEPAGRSLRALLRAADKRGARLAIILGEEELAAGRATVRDLARHEDRRQVLPFDAPAAELARLVGDLVASPT